MSAVSSPLQSVCLTVHWPHSTRAVAPLSARLSHLITLSLAASLRSYPWQPASNNGESSGPSMGGEWWRGEGKSAGDGETEEDGKKRKEKKSWQTGEGTESLPPPLTDARVRAR